MASRAYNGIVSPESTKDLLAVRDAFTQYGPEVQRRIESAGREQLTRAWTEELGKRTGANPQQASIIKAFPLVAVSTFSVVAATGGMGKLAFLTRASEFGADREAFKPARYPRRGTTQRAGSYPRRTRRQLPSLSARGWIAYPAAGAWAKRVYAMYLEIAVLIGHQAAEGDIRGR